MDIVYRFDPLAQIETHQPRTNREALKRLSVGNARFAKTVAHLQEIGSGERVHEPMIISVNPVTLGVPIVSGLEPAHAPFALVLGCSDARVPIEHVLDCSANDLFVVRVAGNVLGLECLGSIDYAATALRSSLRSVVVMAHTGCGAVNAAVDIYLSPSSFTNIAFSHALRSLLDRVMLSVRGSAQALESAVGSKVHQDKNYRQWLTNTAVYMNAAVTAFDLQREMQTVAKGLSVSYTVYDMAWTRIGALPCYEVKQFGETPPFQPAPKNDVDFQPIAESVVRRVLKKQ